MFVDPADLPADGVDCDIAIIGAGAAGITLASALDDGHRRIVLVEGGGFDIEPAAQQMFTARSIGLPIDTIESRYRTFGGTTVAWTGRCATLDPLDFVAREWVPGSGWPVSAGEMAPYYARAAAVCGFEDGWDRAPPAFEAASALPHRPASIDPFLWRFWGVSRDNFQHWGSRFYQAFAGSSTIRVLLGANLVGLTPCDDGRRIGNARLRIGDRQVGVRARHFALCCGGIENARLLLNIAEDEPALLGAAAPVIGRYFMQHPRPATAEIALDSARAARLQRTFNRFKRNRGIQFETGMALSEAAQREGALLNASAIFRYRSRKPAGRADIGAALRIDRALGSAVRRLRGREPILGNVSASVILDLEQQPDRDSRILLDPGRDAIGLRTAAIDWRIGEAERRTSSVFTKAICGWIQQAGFGSPTMLDEIDRDGGLRSGHMLESYHHLGATRMASDPRHGVVDAHLRVHGTHNLHVCGGSVMPTGGHANPTLTIVALALRLATRLNEIDGVPPSIQS